MRLYIPSCSRWGMEILTLRHTREAELVVPPDQAAQYRRSLYNKGMEEVPVLECPERGIAATRLWIGRLAASRGEDKFCMMDDDLYEFFWRKNTEVTNLVYPQNKRAYWTEMMEWISTSLDTHAHASVSAREGNHNAGLGDVVSLAELNTRTLRVLAYRTRDFLSVEHGRVEVMEDFDVNLQLLRRGLSNVCSFWYSQGQRGTGAKGGCSDYRTEEVQDAAARRLAELHPGFVRLRQKKNVSGGLRERTEVTISWKKAAEDGLTYLAAINTLQGGISAPTP